eukprot:scaffold1610_cov257-Pinguiococcus_pyrenoidosus.AAC.43
MLSYSGTKRYGTSIPYPLTANTRVLLVYSTLPGPTEAAAVVDVSQSSKKKHQVDSAVLIRLWRRRPFRDTSVPSAGHVFLSYLSGGLWGLRHRNLALATRCQRRIPGTREPPAGEVAELSGFAEAHGGRGAHSYRDSSAAEA